MKRKGEQSLQMIFGLFLLLIISLVVLAMFFKFVKKGSSETSTAAEEYIKSANIEKAKTECTNLCNEANDDNTKIEFCSSVFEVDWNSDGSVEGSAQNGAWWFCEKKIPCFVLVPDCKNRYDGKYCRTLLAELAKNKYDRLFIDSEKETPLSATDYGDGCDLPISTSCPAEPCPAGTTLDEKYPTAYNWKERFCFSTSYTDVLLPTFTCPGDALN